MENLISVGEKFQSIHWKLQGLTFGIEASWLFWKIILFLSRKCTYGVEGPLKRPHPDIFWYWRLCCCCFSVKVFSLKNHCGCKHTHIIQPHTTIHLVIARIITGGNVAYIFLLGKMRRLKFSSNHFCHLSWLFSNTSSFLCCPQYYKWIEWRTLIIPVMKISFCWFIIFIIYSKVQKSLHAPLALTR